MIMARRNAALSTEPVMRRRSKEESFGVSGNATAIGGADQGGVRTVFSEAGPRCLGRVLLRVNVPFNS